MSNTVLYSVHEEYKKWRNLGVAGTIKTRTDTGVLPENQKSKKAKPLKSSYLDEMFRLKRASSCLIVVL